MANGERLFRIVRGERPSPALRARTLAAMRAVAREPSQQFRTSRRRKRARVAVIGMVLAAAASFGIIAKRDTASRRGGTIAAEAIGGGTPTARTQPSPPTQASVAPAFSASIPPPTRPSVARAPKRRPSLAEETAALDEIRAATQSGDSSRALRLLDEYERRGEGANRMSSEATVLRIEALLQGGRTAKAKELAHAFMEQHADSPLTDRARALISKLDSSNDAGATP